MSRLVTLHVKDEQVEGFSVSKHSCKYYLTHIILCFLRERGGIMQVELDRACRRARTRTRELTLQTLWNQTPARPLRQTLRRWWWSANRGRGPSGFICSGSRRGLRRVGRLLTPVFTSWDNHSVPVSCNMLIRFWYRPSDVEPNVDSSSPGLRRFPRGASLSLWTCSRRVCPHVTRTPCCPQSNRNWKWSCSSCNELQTRTVCPDLHWNALKLSEHWVLFEGGDQISFQSLYKSVMKRVNNSSQQ